MEVTERRQKLVDSPDFTGFDFVSVDETEPRRLFVHFIGDLPAASTIGETNVTITSQDHATISVESVGFLVLDGEDVLEVVVDDLGDDVPHTISADTAWIDRCFDTVTFSFFVHCARDVDCVPIEPPEVDAATTFLPNYQGRDYNSFLHEIRHYLSAQGELSTDFHPADFLTAFSELIAALGDELTGFQDSIYRERFLSSALQPRSVEALAALVDYQRGKSQVETVWVQLSADIPTTITSGDAVRLIRENTNHERLQLDDIVAYELGRSFDAILSREPIEIFPVLNELEPYIWDDSKVVLRAGSSQCSVVGDLSSAFSFNEPGAFADSGRPGRWVVVQTFPDNACKSERIALRVVAIEVVADPLNANAPVTNLRWETPTAHDIDFDGALVFANIVAAMSGRTETRFAFDGDPPLASLSEVVRTNGRTVDGERHAVKRSFIETTDQDTLNFDNGLPQMRVTSFRWDSADPAEIISRVESNTPLDTQWTYTDSFVGLNSSTPLNFHFVIESGKWGSVYQKWTPSGEFNSDGYASSSGKSVRFGDGEFGRNLGSNSLLRFDYRVGTGAQYRVGNDTLTEWVHHADDLLRPPESAPAVRASNVLLRRGGHEEETLESIRRLAPEVFRRLALRAVRPQDYADFASQRSDVQRANCAFRWTGSFTEAFVTVDPADRGELTRLHANQIATDLDQYRQIARPVNVVEPHYIDLQIEAVVCIEQGVHRSEVLTEIDAVLFGSAGFFDPDHWTFGQPLFRSQLEACLQSVVGVEAVIDLFIKLDGRFARRAFDEEVFRLDPDSVLRVSRTPGRGSITIYARGGR